MILLSIILLLRLAGAQTINAACNNFQTNGSAAALFIYYRFYDFRSLYRVQGSSLNSNTGALKIVKDSSWSSDWHIRLQQKPAANSVSNPFAYTLNDTYITNNTSPSLSSSTYLTLRTARLPDGSQTAGELDYVEKNVTFASLRMLARVHGAAGAVAGFFTYHDDDSESDVEILTRDPDTFVHYSNQPVSDPATGLAVSGSTFNVSVGTSGNTSDWNVHRLDWVRGNSAWYMNGVQMATTGVNVPSVASMVILNMWSNGGTFSGLMPMGGEAWLDVQWIEMAYNTSAASQQTHAGKPVLCSVDEEVGVPTLSSTGRKLMWDRRMIFIEAFTFSLVVLLSN